MREQERGSARVGAMPSKNLCKIYFQLQSDLSFSMNIYSVCTIAMNRPWLDPYMVFLLPLRW